MRNPIRCRRGTTALTNARSSTSLHALRAKVVLGLVRHTDAEREWAYDCDSHIGELDRVLDEALSRKWVVVDMKQDWKVIYPAGSGAGAVN